MIQNKERIINPNRVSSRIGDIFCVELDTSEKAYFQYIANDLYMLNSSVIRVFQKHYPADYTPTMEEIVSDEVQFYAHTTINPGQKTGAWIKVGKSKNVGNANDAFFRVSDSGNINNKKVYDWIIWHLDSEPQNVGRLSKKLRCCSHQGEVIPADLIVHKIKFGEYYGYLAVLE